MLSSLYAKAKPKAREPITATVTKVVDGDTLKIKHNGQDGSVRLIGIDTPESKANKKAKKDAERSKAGVVTITSMGKVARDLIKTHFHAKAQRRKEQTIQ